MGGVGWGVEDYRPVAQSGCHLLVVTSCCPVCLRSSWFMREWRLKKIKVGMGPLAAEFERVSGERGQLHRVYILMVGDHFERESVQLASASNVDRPRLTAEELDMGAGEDVELLLAYMTLVNSPGFSASSFIEALRCFHETFVSKDA